MRSREHEVREKLNTKRSLAVDIGRAMRHPSQAVLLHPSKPVVYMAISCYLYAFDAAAGSLIAKRHFEEERVGLPKKKQKLSSDDHGAWNANANRGTSFVRCLAVENGGKFVMCTTDDKFLYVLDATSLSLVNKRAVQKRASKVVHKDDLILVADKSGDVYSYPLHAPAASNDHPSREDDLVKSRFPGGGRLLLGHVSMLFDMCVAQAGENSFVITCDRDEHIRVTHYPNTYDIESYMLKHTSYVSQLALQGDTVFSAGGDGRIIRWKWPTQEVVEEFDIRALAEQVETAKHLDVSCMALVGWTLVFILERLKAIFIIDVHHKMACKQVIRLDSYAISFSLKEALLLVSLDCMDGGPLVQLFSSGDGQYKAAAHTYTSAMNAQDVELGDRENAENAIFPWSQVRKSNHEQQ